MDQIGDFLLSRGFISAVIEADPTTVLIINNTVYPVAAHCFPNTQLVSVSLHQFRTQLRYRIAVMWQIRQLNMSRCIHPVYSRHHFIVDAEAICRASGAPEVIGFRGELLYGIREWARRVGSISYTHLVPTVAIHESDKYGDLSCVLKIANRPLFTIPAPEYKRSWNAPYVVLFPVANTWQRQWPISHWMEVITHLMSQPMTVLLCGDKPSVVIDAIMAMGAPNLVSMIGKTSIQGLMGILKDAEWCAGVDGGGIHLSAAVGTRTLAIAGGGHWGRFVPYSDVRTVYYQMSCFGCRWQCIFPGEHHVPCMTKISSQDVISILTEWSQIR